MSKHIWIVQFIPPASSAEPGADSGAAFPNILAVGRELGGNSGESPFMQRSPWPAAAPLQVAITNPRAALDWWALPLAPLASARLRAAWASAGDSVEYRTVDASNSCGEARKANYCLMHVIAEESVVDPARSDYDTSAEMTWLPKGFPFYVRSLALREDASPRRPLFRDTFARNHIFCTDAMAMRALKAGCTGVRFVDPATQRLMAPMRYRTLAGIAETSDAALAHGETERLVARIP